MSEKKKKYGHSLNLPRETLPLQIDVKQLESRILKRWNSEATYKKILELRKDQPPFFLHDGPPYANGEIHVGHALNKLLKDFAVKAKGMSGFYAPFTPGWDCHGLPIEVMVEKKLGQAASEAKGFREACRNYADKQLDLQREAFMSLGILADWEAPYKTMNLQVRAGALKLLGTLYRHGLVVRGVLPVHWCIKCQSALSIAELEYQNLVSVSAYVCFPFTASPFLQKLLQKETIASLLAVIWTTTLWTLPANEAVAVNPDLLYQVVQPSGENKSYLIEKSRVNFLKERLGWSDYEVRLECLGCYLEGSFLCHPLLAKEVPLICSRHVSSHSGSGLVHIAPAHGPEDYELGKLYHLPIQTNIKGTGRFSHEDTLVPGMTIEEASVVLRELLEAQGGLLLWEDHLHSYPHCWRHKHPLMLRATPQWFIDLDKPFGKGQKSLREMALEAIETVDWVPEWGKERLKQGLISRPNWCISRQRVWGLPIPIFIHKETGLPHPNTAEQIEMVAGALERAKPDYAWEEIDAKALLGEEASKYEKETSVLDVWFDSGATHLSTKNKTGAQDGVWDLYLEGGDQFRGWFMSSLMIALGVQGAAPYKTVVAHGFTVDRSGRKMSKSLGNVITPKEIVDYFGAEVLRVWAASSDYHAEVALSEEHLKKAQEVKRKVRNTLRYLLGNLYDFKTTDLLPPEALVAFDQWILGQAIQLQGAILEAYHRYEYYKVQQLLMQFCTTDLSAYYLDIIKDRLYTLPSQSHARRSAQTALYHLLQSLVRWVAPIFSFTAEEVWEHMNPTRQSIFLEEWWKLPEIDRSRLKVSEEMWPLLADLRQRVFAAIERAITEGRVKNALSASLHLNLPAAQLHKLEPLEKELAFYFCVSSVQLVSEEGEEPKVEVAPSSAPQCPRCWQWVIDLSKEQEVCERCAKNSSLESCEERYYF